MGGWQYVIRPPYKYSLLLYVSPKHVRLTEFEFNFNGKLVPLREKVWCFFFYFFRSEKDTAAVWPCLSETFTSEKFCFYFKRIFLEITDFFQGKIFIRMWNKLNSVKIFLFYCTMLYLRGHSKTTWLGRGPGGYWTRMPTHVSEIQAYMAFAGRTWSVAKMLSPLKINDGNITWICNCFKMQFWSRLKHICRSA